MGLKFRDMEPLTTLTTINTCILALAGAAFIWNALPPKKAGKLWIPSEPRPGASGVLLASCLVGGVVGVICLAVAASQADLTNIVLAGAASMACLQVARNILKREGRRWEKENDEKAVALLSLTDGASTMTIRITGNEGKEWPPLKLEVSNGRETRSAEESPNVLKEISKTGTFNRMDAEGRERLKEALKHHGATHPMDIEGADKDPGILAFLEDILLGKPG